MSRLHLGRRAVESARVHAPQLVGSLLADLVEAHVGLADLHPAATCFAEARQDWDTRSIDGNHLSPTEQLGAMVSEGRVGCEAARSTP